MTPGNFVLVQLAVAIALLPLLKSLGATIRGVLRLAVYTASLAYLFDYFANRQEIWTLEGFWKPRLFGNPIENLLFTVAMTIHALILHQTVERTLTGSPRSGRSDIPSERR